MTHIAQTMQILEDESLLNYHIGLILTKMENQSQNLRQALIEHCNFVYLSLMLLFRSNSYPKVKENKKSADFILENIIENSFILM